MILSGGLSSDSSNPVATWILLGLLIKTRISPFHFWGAALVTKLDGISTFIFLTWQKVAPLYLIFVSTSKNLLRGFVLINLLVSVSCSIGSKATFVLLFFSGLMHMGWILSAPMRAARLYFIIYFVCTAPIFFQPSHNFPILIINLAGLPPLTGFFMKLCVLQLVNFCWGFFLLLFSSFLLFAYIRVFLWNSALKSPLKFPSIVVCCIGLLNWPTSRKHLTFN